MKRKPIFTITCGRMLTRTYTIKRTDKKSPSGKTIFQRVPIEDPEEEWDSRMFGFYHSFEEAEKDVLENAMNIHEMDYDIACVEETYEGVYNIHSRKQTFYVWEGDEDTGGYEKIEGWPKDLESYYDRWSIYKTIGRIG